MISWVSSSNCFFAAARNSGEVSKSRIQAAISLAPTTRLLWAIEVVGAIQTVHCYACTPGIVEGNRRKRHLHANEASNYQLGAQFAAVASFVIDEALKKGLGRALPAEWFSQKLRP